MDQIVLIAHVKYGKTNSKRSICCYRDFGKIHDFWISAPHHLCINIFRLLCNEGRGWGENWKLNKLLIVDLFPSCNCIERNEIMFLF